MGSFKKNQQGKDTQLSTQSQEKMTFKMIILAGLLT